VGGRIGSTFIIGLSNNVSTNEVYDIAKDTWASVLGMPTPRSGVGVAVLDGRMHVLGGEAYINDLVGTYRPHEAYDPKTNAWERLPPMPTPRHGLAVGEVGGKMYAISGSNVAGGGGPHEGVNVNEVYDPAARERSAEDLVDLEREFRECRVRRPLTAAFRLGCCGLPRCRVTVDFHVLLFRVDQPYFADRRGHGYECVEPQPDLTLLRPRSDFYSRAHPEPADVLREARP